MLFERGSLGKAGGSWLPKHDCCAPQAVCNVGEAGLAIAMR